MRVSRLDQPPCVAGERRDIAAHIRDFRRAQADDAVQCLARHAGPGRIDNHHVRSLRRRRQKRLDRLSQWLDSVPRGDVRNQVCGRHAVAFDGAHRGMLCRRGTHSEQSRPGIEVDQRRASSNAADDVFGKAVRRYLLP